MLFAKKSLDLPTVDTALPGRSIPLPTAETHFINGRPLKGPYPDGLEVADFAMGCFWGVERKFWQVPGVWVTAVGYQNGITPNPTYEEVCSGGTGHAEAVRVTFDPQVIALDDILDIFFATHDPTQLNRQGNDVGTQYRSGIYYTTPQQRDVANDLIREAGQDKLYDGSIVTEVLPLAHYFAAEDYHQDFFEKNPTQGYCMAVAAPKVSKFRKTFRDLAKG